MSSARLPILLVCGACATMGMFLWSGPEERIAKLARDGRTGEAATAAEKILQKGQATPQLLTTLARVYEMGGAPPAPRTSSKSWPSPARRIRASCAG